MSGLNLTSLTTHVNDGVQSSINDVSSFANQMDATNPSDLLKMQMKMMRMNMFVQLQSAMVKELEDALKSATQRM